MKEAIPQYRLDAATNYYPEIIDFMDREITGFDVRSLHCAPDDLPAVIKSFSSSKQALCMIKASFPADSRDLWCDTESLSQRYGLSFVQNNNPDEQDPVEKEKGSSICVGVALKKLGLINSGQLERYKQIFHGSYNRTQGKGVDRPIFTHAIAVKIEDGCIRLSDQYGEVVVGPQVLIEIAKARKTIDSVAEIAVIFLPKGSDHK